MFRRVYGVVVTLGLPILLEDGLAPGSIPGGRTVLASTKAYLGKFQLSIIAAKYFASIHYLQYR